MSYSDQRNCNQNQVWGRNAWVPRYHRYPTSQQFLAEDGIKSERDLVQAPIYCELNSVKLQSVPTNCGRPLTCNSTSRFGTKPSCYACHFQSWNLSSIRQVRGFNERSNEVHSYLWSGLECISMPRLGLFGHDKWWYRSTEIWAGNSHSIETNQSITREFKCRRAQIGHYWKDIPTLWTWHGAFQHSIRLPPADTVTILISIPSWGMANHDGWFRRNPIGAFQELRFVLTCTL